VLITPIRRFGCTLSRAPRSMRHCLRRSPLRHDDSIACRLSRYRHTVSKSADLHAPLGMFGEKSRLLVGLTRRNARSHCIRGPANRICERVRAHDESSVHCRTLLTGSSCWDVLSFNRRAEPFADVLQQFGPHSKCALDYVNRRILSNRESGAREFV
jgi:hypothetical protein